MMSSLGVFLGVILTLSHVSGQDNRHLLHTPYGTITGLRESLVVSDRRPPMTYYAFKGIEYATAERWEESKLKELDEIQATTSGSLCPQWSLTGQTPVGLEDCLFLNVYTPTVPIIGRSGGQGVGSTLSTSQLPVMVYFHGGGYMYGDSTHAGPQRMMRQRKVVLVTCNYRLGVLGYLSTGDAEIPGNFGGLDQIKALEWVQKYISYFGGNPNRVTIFGNSAGAASTHLLILSPRALGLFHGAIIQSGNALCDWATESDPAQFTQDYANKLECTGSSADLTTCLKGKSVQQLITVQQELLDLWVFPIRTAPVVDGGWRGDDGFLPKSPDQLMDAGAFAQVPILTGVVHDEGLMGYAEIHLEVGPEKFKDADYFDKELLPKMLAVMMEHNEEMDVVTDAVRKQYFNDINVENDTKQVISAMSDLVGDVTIYSCHRNFLEKLVASNTSAYSYLFTHKTPKSPSAVGKSIEKLRKQAGVHPDLFDFGVAHCDENLYLFEPYEGSMHRMEAEDLRVADQMVNIWSSFAATWNPLNGMGRAAPWRPLREGSIEYYNIPENRTQEFRTGESVFWLRTIPYVQELGANIKELGMYQTLFWIFLGLATLFLLITLILAIVLWRKRSSQAVNL